VVNVSETIQITVFPKQSLHILLWFLTDYTPKPFVRATSADRKPISDRKTFKMLTALTSWKTELWKAYCIFVAVGGVKSVCTRKPRTKMWVLRCLLRVTRNKSRLQWLTLGDKFYRLLSVYKKLRCCG